MNEETFAAGMEELKDIFPRFKLSARQQATWFRLLRHYDDTSMRAATSWLCEREEQPSFYRLKFALSRVQVNDKGSPDVIYTRDDIFYDSRGRVSVRRRMPKIQNNGLLDRGKTYEYDGRQVTPVTDDDFSWGF